MGAVAVKQGGGGWKRWGHPLSCLLLVQEWPSPEAGEDSAAIVEAAQVLVVP